METHRPLKSLWFLCVSALVIVVTITPAVQSQRYPQHDKLFERYSKMKLLSECFGQETIARWRRQVSAASKECQRNPPFIAAILHQIPAVTLQQPPSYFVPNVPQSVVISPSRSSATTNLRVSQGTNTGSNNFGTSYVYVRQPFHSIVYPRTSLSYLPWVKGNYYVSPPIIRANPSPLFQKFVTTKKVSKDGEEDESCEKHGTAQPVEKANTKPAGQKESYSNPSLKYEDTQQFYVERHQEMTRRQNQQRNFHSTRNRRSADLGGNKRQTENRMRTLLRSRVSDRIGNMTCVMKALKMINDNLEPEFGFLRDSLLELPISNDIYDDLKSGMEYCENSRSCRFDRPLLHQIPIKTEFSDSLEFFRCFGRERLRTCLNANLEGMVRLMEREQVVNPLNGFYEPQSQVSSAVEELEDLMIGSTGHFVDMLLM